MNNIIFVISQPRSGSTLLQKILESSHEISSPDETWLPLVMTSLLSDEITIEADYDFSLARQAVKNFLDTAEIKNEFEQGIKNIINNVYTKAAGNSTYFLEKTPRNYFIMDSLYHLFPDAKFIILTRNPVAVASSILASWHNNNIDALKMHYHDLIEAPQKIYTFTQEHVNFIHVIYEELIQDTERVLEKLSKFLLLNTPLMNSYTVNREIRFGDNLGVYRSNKVNSSSLDKWKRDSPSQLCLYFWYLQKLPYNVKIFFFQNANYLNETEEFLSTYKDVVPIEKGEYLFSKPIPYIEQLIEKEAVIQVKEKTLISLYQQLDEKEAVIQQFKRGLSFYLLHRLKTFFKGNK